MFRCCKREEKWWLSGGHALFGTGRWGVEIPFPMNRGLLPEVGEEAPMSMINVGGTKVYFFGIIGRDVRIEVTPKLGPLAAILHVDNYGFVDAELVTSSERIPIRYYLSGNVKYKCAGQEVRLIGFIQESFYVLYELPDGMVVSASVEKEAWVRSVLGLRSLLMRMKDTLGIGMDTRDLLDRSLRMSLWSHGQYLEGGLIKEGVPPINAPVEFNPLELMQAKARLAKRKPTTAKNPTPVMGDSVLPPRELELLFSGWSRELPIMVNTPGNYPIRRFGLSLTRPELLEEGIILKGHLDALAIVLEKRLDKDRGMLATPPPTT